MYGLRFLGNRHGATLHEPDDECAVYLQAAVVDEDRSESKGKEKAELVRPGLKRAG